MNFSISSTCHPNAEIFWPPEQVLHSMGVEWVIAHTGWSEGKQKAWWSRNTAQLKLKRACNSHYSLLLFRIDSRKHLLKCFFNWNNVSANHQCHISRARLRKTLDTFSVSSWLYLRMQNLLVVKPADAKKLIARADCIYWKDPHKSVEPCSWNLFCSRVSCSLSKISQVIGVRTWPDILSRLPCWWFFPILTERALGVLSWWTVRLPSPAEWNRGCLTSGPLEKGFEVLWRDAIALSVIHTGLLTSTDSR